MSGNENFFCTSIVVTACFLAAVSVKNIASIIQIAGATSSTAVGYCLPALFYLKMDQIKNGGQWTFMRGVAHLINVSFLLFSLMSLSLFAYKLLTG